MTQTPHLQIQKEIDSYLDFPPVDAEVDPLAWWKVERGRFPNLANLAKKYLYICGTSVPSERIFSTANFYYNVSKLFSKLETLTNVQLYMTTCSSLCLHVHVVF